MKSFKSLNAVALSALASVFAIALMPLIALAQDAGTDTPAADPYALFHQLAVVVVPVLTPVVVAFVKKLAAGIPGNLVPIIAPFAGMAIAALGSAFGIDLTAGSGVVVGGAVLGSAGVGVREVVNQNFNGKRKL